VPVGNRGGEQGNGGTGRFPLGGVGRRYQKRAQVKGRDHAAYLVRSKLKKLLIKGDAAEREGRGKESHRMKKRKCSRTNNIKKRREIRISKIKFRRIGKTNGHIQRGNDMVLRDRDLSTKKKEERKDQRESEPTGNQVRLQSQAEEESNRLGREVGRGMVEKTSAAILIAKKAKEANEA